MVLLEPAQVVRGAGVRALRDPAGQAQRVVQAVRLVEDARHVGHLVAGHGASQGWVDVRGVDAGRQHVRPAAVRGGEHDAVAGLVEMEQRADELLPPVPVLRQQNKDRAGHLSTPSRRTRCGGSVRPFTRPTVRSDPAGVNGEGAPQSHGMGVGLPLRGEARNSRARRPRFGPCRAALRQLGTATACTRRSAAAHGGLRGPPGAGEAAARSARTSSGPAGQVRGQVGAGTAGLRPVGRGRAPPTPPAAPSGRPDRRRAWPRGPAPGPRPPLRGS